MQRRTALLILTAVAGLVLTAGIMVAASRLSSQHVGLSSEPLSAGDRLAPAAVRSHPARNRTRHVTRRTRTNPSPASSPSSASPSGTGAARPAPRSSGKKVAGTDDSGKKESRRDESDDD